MNVDIEHYSELIRLFKYTFQNLVRIIRNGAVRKNVVWINRKPNNFKTRCMNQIPIRFSDGWHAMPAVADHGQIDSRRSEEHTSELQSLMRISYAVFCLKTKQHIRE